MDVIATTQSPNIVEKVLEVIANLSIEQNCKVAIREQNVLPFLVNMLNQEEHVTLSLRAIAHLTVDSLNRKCLFELDAVYPVIHSLEARSKKLFSHCMIVIENMMRYGSVFLKFM